MEIRELYDLAGKENIPVIPYPMPRSGSMSVMTDSGRCYIGMDPTVRDGSVSEKVHLAHELGHCLTGSFYNIHAAIDTRLRHEYRADKWSVTHLIPVDDLDQAIADGCCELWELADRFGVTEQLMRKAVCYYVHGNLATELYF